MSGKLVIIGGAEDQERRCTILKAVLSLSGEANPRVVIIAAASTDPVEIGENYEQVFKDLGAESVRLLKVPGRDIPRDDSAAAWLQEAAVVFLTGGDQLRLTNILGGSSLFRLFKERFKQGIILAGTSAGA